MISPNAVLIFLVVTCWFFPLLGGAADLAQQRQDFRDALEALAHDNTMAFEHLLPGLADYPLYGYLLYEDLKARGDTAPDTEIQAFLTRYADLPVTASLRNLWLKRLAALGRWSDFLIHYRQTDDIALRCLQAQALRAKEPASAEPSAQWKKDVLELWLSSKKQPDECETTFTLWQEAGGMTPDDLWQRIALAFSVGNVELAEELGALLPARERAWVRVWALAHRSPRRGLNDPLLADDSPRARIVIGHAIIRLGRESVAGALERWKIVQDQYSFSNDARDYIDRGLALRAAANRDPSALKLLEKLAFPDAEVRRARVRAALWAEDWPAVLRLVRALQPWERAADRWRYWEARAWAATGQRPAAEEIFRDLATQRGYHNFLAADQVDRPYAFNHRPLVTAESDMARLAARPALERAHEWLLGGYLPEGRREWTAALTGLSGSDLNAAAQLAARWNWADRVIATLGRTPEEDDLTLRFPLAYQRQALERAAAAGLAPAAVLAVARQESIFMPDVRSTAGALGLMQLMPATAAEVARGLKISYPGIPALLNPDYNLRLGSTFLAQMIKNQGSLALAAAAYNAGPGRVRQWRPAAKMAADVWVESIPFDETRRYVRNVLTYAVIYGWRLNQPLERLADTMPAVKP